MGLQATSNRLAQNEINVQQNASKNHLLYSAATLRPVNKNKISNSSPFLISLIIAFIVFIPYLIRSIIMNTSSNDKMEILQFILFSSTCYSYIILYILTTAWVASYFNSKIIGIEHESKDTMIFMSIFIYFPAVAISSIFLTVLGGIISFAVAMLMSYFIQASYAYVTLADTRESVIHSVYVYVAVFSMMILLESSYLHIEDVILSIVKHYQ